VKVERASSSERRADSLWRWAIPLVVTVVYVSLLAALPPDVFWSPDEGGKLLQIESYRLDLDRAYAVRYGARTLDPGYRFYPELHLYPQPSESGGVWFNWPHLFPRLSWLPYRVFGLRGLSLLPLLAGVAAAALCLALARRIEPSIAPAAALTAALASPLLVYSLLFWEHTPAVALGLGALVLLLPSDVRGDAGAVNAPSRLGRPGSLAVLGGLGCLAAAVLQRLELILFGASLAGAWLAVELLEPGGRLRSPARRRLTALATSALALASIAWLWSFDPSRQGVRFDSTLRVVVDDVRARAFSSQFWSLLPGHLRRAWFGATTEVTPETIGAVGWCALLALALALASAFPRGRLGDRASLAGVGIATVVSVTSLAIPIAAGQRVRAVHGLALLAPYLLATPRFVRLALDQVRADPLSANRLSANWRSADQGHDGRATRLLALAAGIYLALATAVGLFGQLGGLEWGDRYMLMAYPLGALCAWGAFARMHRRARGAAGRAAVAAVAIAAAATGLMFQIRGHQEIRHTKLDLVAVKRAVERAALPVVTDLAWLPGAMPTTFLETPLFVLADREDLGDWLARSPSPRFRLVFDPTRGELDAWLASVAPTALVVERNRDVRGLRVVDLAVSDRAEPDIEPPPESGPAPENGDPP
jgi:hypothetical protein